MKIKRTLRILTCGLMLSAIAATAAITVSAATDDRCPSCSQPLTPGTICACNDPTTGPATMTPTNPGGFTPLPNNPAPNDPTFNPLPNNPAPDYPPFDPLPNNPAPKDPVDDPAEDPIEEPVEEGPKTPAEEAEMMEEVEAIVTPPKTGVMTGGFGFGMAAAALLMLLRKKK